VAELFCNDVAVLEGTLTLPRLGAWHADLVLDGPLTTRDAATVRSADGGLVLRGSVVRGGGFQERGGVRIVGGQRGLAREVAPRFYRGVPARVPIGDLLRDCGERLSTATDLQRLDVVLPRWVRLRGPASTALAHLLDATSAAWRVLPDGTLWIGAEAWPVIDLDTEVFDDDPADDRMELAFDQIPPTLRPGTTFLGRHVGTVEHIVAAARVRTLVWFEANEGEDRSGGALEALVRQITRATAYHALYWGRVVTQTADGSLEVQPDLPLLPPMTSVPIRSFAPNVTLRVTEGARVLVGFEDGAPSRPMAVLWQSDAGKLQALEIGAEDHVQIDAARIRLGARAVKAAGLDGDVIMASGGAAPPNGMAGWMAQVTAALNGLAPGAVTVPVPREIGTLHASASKVFGE
jgi:hypothetical protein